MADAGLKHADWLQRVPDLVTDCCKEWGLRLGEPYPAGAAGYAVRAELPEGTPAVLKLIFPHREAEHEAATLALWDGEGAVRLLAHDPERQALLLERCEPGAPLGDLDADAALDVLVGLLPRLWKPAGQPFRPLSEEAGWWIESLPDEWERAGRPFERPLLDAAIDALRGLSVSQGEQVLLHQDLHGDNVLAAEREPWLAIDPKPLVGERELGLAPIIRSFELGHGRREVVHRLDRLTSELGLDRERARGWAIGQTIAWSVDSGYLPTHVETARWLLEAAPARSGWIEKKRSMTIRAVLFDVDFTLCRPGPELSAERYARIAARHGLRLDISRYDDAREAAVLNLERHPELVHDDSIWHAFTEEIFVGLGGPRRLASECATEIEEGWSVSENFELFEDALPVLEDLRAHGLKIGLVSNGIRDLHAFVAHHRLAVDAIVDSRSHGRVKPHPTIFQAALEQLEASPVEAVMVGDSLADDIEGAYGLGMRAILIDREDRHPEVEDRLTDLYGLPAALGLARP